MPRYDHSLLLLVTCKGIVDKLFKATKGLAAEFGPRQIRVNSVCPLLGGTGL